MESMYHLQIHPDEKKIDFRKHKNPPPSPLLNHINIVATGSDL